MAAIDDLTTQSRSVQQGGPVFVDPSGRRLGRLKLLGLGAFVLVAGYAALLLVALMGGSNTAAPFLPLPAVPAAAEIQPTPAKPSPAQTHQPSNSNAAAGLAAETGAQAQAPAPQSQPGTLDAATPVEDAAAVLPVEPQPAPSAAPPAADQAGGQAGAADGTAPGKSAEAPGKSVIPSAPARP
ncbi:hypothetical protein V1639_11720 [Pseudarthrobacter sp. J75]|uniref:hypothetical protein n=1 Tax=unclassified Pseudarthrobacter TaxID=2647000 RepID=UPI002E811E92|nr:MULTISPECIES: hypothetical protein [unclassified Pseudarthrobacter]MEE2523004.1 hypothetical protein [Pseudarthrobacter sp. J47]MEE2529687.1 hypothetical protein [Pseudarthrobacter sp. J75]MEE2568996.1 hypothetical protein [Pseudarthrobacter sp. J64]